jgi:hypothetical protein
MSINGASRRLLMMTTVLFTPGGTFTTSADIRLIIMIFDKYMISARKDIRPSLKLISKSVTGRRSRMILLMPRMVSQCCIGLFSKG